MSWMLDTDCCSFAIRGQFGVRSALSARPLARIHVSTITIVTRNVAELGRVPNLKVESWVQS